MRNERDEGKDEEALETLMHPNMMVFEKWELEMFKTLAPYLNKNPRKVKRVTNVYTMIRSLAKAQGEQVNVVALRKRLLVWYVALRYCHRTVAHLMHHYHSQDHSL